MRLENLLQRGDFSFNKDKFYHHGNLNSGDFEKIYVSLRGKENRLYSDIIVRNLPDLPLDHPQGKEWLLRKSSLNRLLQYLKSNCKNRHALILEVGCGNGWLSNHLASIDKCEVLGVDINEKELNQGARVFSGRKNLCFACTDVMASKLPGGHFDYIILAASLQYFRDIDKLLGRLSSLLVERGEIHVIDTPLYKESEVAAAQRRSIEYFRKQNSQLGEFYYHHTWESLAKFKYEVLYDPRNPIEKIRRLFRPTSPFPWLRLKNDLAPFNTNSVTSSGTI